MYYICIDPGLKGAISVTDDDRKVVFIDKIPYTKKSFSTKSNKKNKEISIIDTRKLITLFKNIKEKLAYQKYHLFVERLFPTGRLAPYSVFNMGMNYGVLLACIEAVYEKYNIINPNSWQKFIFKEYRSLVTGSDTKKASIAISSHLFGDEVLIPKKARTKSDGFSDSLLISEYVRLRGFEQL